MNKYTAYISTLMTRNNKNLHQLDWSQFATRRKNIVIEQIGIKPIITNITELTPYFIRIKNQNHTCVLFRRQFNHTWRAWNKIPTYNESRAHKWATNSTT